MPGPYPHWTDFKRLGRTRFAEANSGGIFKPPPGKQPEPLDETEPSHFWSIDFIHTPVTTGEGCEQIDDSHPGTEYHYYRQKCDAAGITAVDVDLGDGNDGWGVTTDVPATIRGGAGDDKWLTPPVHGLVDGGPGDDEFPYLWLGGEEPHGDSVIRGGPGRDTFAADQEPPGYTASDPGLHVSLDGVADDGFRPAGHDNVLPDVEDVYGGVGPDLIAGSAADNTIVGNLSSDTLSGGAGDDSIDAIDLAYGQGVRASDTEFRATRDRVACGPGRDQVKADTLDLIAPGCEHVTRYVAETIDDPDANGQQIALHAVLTTITGSARGERLTGSSAGKNVIHAGGGADRIAGGAGHDRIYAGAGNDLVRPSAGADLVDAGSGADVIRARDGDADLIDCGPGPDLVIADHGDIVGRTCERVRRG